LLVTMAALARALPASNLTVLTRGALAVGSDGGVDPARAALGGLVRTADAEGTLPSVRLIDLSADAADAEVAAAATRRPAAPVVAIRHGVASTPRLRRIVQHPGGGIPASMLPPGGTALIIGGLGGIGRLVGEYLLVSTGARLLVTGRTSRVELARDGRDAVLADLEGLGDVRYAAVDVADASGLASAVEEAERAWGRPLDLIIDLAGQSIAPQWADMTAHDLSRESASWLRHMLHPKLTGCAAVEALLDSRPGTSIVLFSSANGFFGGTSVGAYAAANTAMEGFAHRWSGQGRTVRCIGWSMWAHTGMNDGSPLVAAAERRGFRIIEPSKGLELFMAALHDPRPWLLAGVDPGNARIKQFLAAEEFDGVNVVVAVMPEDGADAVDVTGRVSAALTGIGVFATVVALPVLPRDPSGAPDHAAILALGDETPISYATPEGEIETYIGEVFSDVLGQHRIGRDDSFFGLGGDSIRATQVMAAVNDRMRRRHPVHLLYLNPTVRELAAVISAADKGA